MFLSILGDTDRIAEWQIWKGVVDDLTTLDYMVMINDQLVFQVLKVFQ
jgi:hypothetical protein